MAVWKFASCDGCQLSILNCEDELLALAGAVDIAYFPEATRGMVAGPYDLSLVEGSVTTPVDAERIRGIRAESSTLVTIGACATARGIQALRNFADVDEFRSVVYAHPGYVSTLDRSTGIATHVHVDFELRGCPIDKGQ
ncbi:MAG: NADH-quinone oxidoreductase subunit B family protein, partial [Frankiaceae bacterium]